MEEENSYDEEDSEKKLSFSDESESSESPKPSSGDGFYKEAVKEKLRKLLNLPTLEELRNMETKEMITSFKKTVLRLRLLYNLLKPLAYKDDSYEDMLYYEMGDDEIPVFNVNAFRKIYKTVTLEWQGKCILTKPAEFRTHDEVHMVKKNLDSLPFFAKYSKRTHFQLAQCLMYESIPPNRTVVHQGHLPLAFYFIISGGMYVEIEEKDKSTGFMKSRVLAELKPGLTFGELALIHNSRRTASVKTKFQTEVLFLYKEDFEKILQSNETNLWWSRYNMLTELHYFSKWTPEQLKQLCNRCRNVEYSHNKVIIGDIRYTRPQNFYIVMEGKCVILEVLRIVHETTKAEPQNLICPPINMTTKQLRDSLIPLTTFTSRVVQIMTLEKGSYFGAGEDLRRRYVVASGQTELMVIPQVYLVNQGQESWLDVLQDNLRSNMPKHKEVFQEFVKNAVWRTYKKELMSDILRDKGKRQKEKMKNVPVSIRVQEKMKDWATLQTHFFH